jgi:hypothetical protein
VHTNPKENDTETKPAGLIQNAAGGIAFLITIAVESALLILIASIEPLAKIVYSDENANITSSVAITLGIVSMLVIRTWLRTPKKTDHE